MNIRKAIANLLTPPTAADKEAAQEWVLRNNGSVSNAASLAKLLAQKRAEGVVAGMRLSAKTLRHGAPTEWTPSQCADGIDRVADGWEKDA